jgi:hypothetical protein
MSELKECPFCGIKQLTDEEAEETVAYTGQTRVCDNCGATAKDWNTRPLEDALQARIAELKKAYMKAEDELDDLLLEREIETAKLKVQIAELEAEVEELKPYKYGYSTRKKPEFYTRVLVDYNGSLDFGDFDDDGNWETCARDNIRRGVTRWYPLPVLPENDNNDPA